MLSNMGGGRVDAAALWLRASQRGVIGLRGCRRQGHHMRACALLGNDRGDAASKRGAIVVECTAVPSEETASSAAKQSLLQLLSRQH